MALETVEEFEAYAGAIEADPGYRAPAAFAVGVATVGGPKVLDTYYPVVNAGTHLRTAAVLSKACGRKSGSGSHRLSHDSLVGVLEAFVPFVADGEYHPNLEAMQDVARMAAGMAAGAAAGPQRVTVVTFVDDLAAPPVDTHDAFLRLHLLSHRLVRPHGLNLDGVFGLLNNVVWTNLGPFDPDDFDRVRARLRAAGDLVRVHSVDKFPRMTDYVVPSGVRIADADRVRLGAHLAPGTTVMHEGFVNFNAGTLGASMVEGRISAGVVVGDGSDIGGGASIMGTLSGGGSEVISVGSGSLLGANAGIGISLGDGCVVEAGCYVTGGSKVTLPDGRVVKARELSGQDGLLFRRNSVSGGLEAVPSGKGRTWGGLNADLHTND